MAKPAPASVATIQSLRPFGPAGDFSQSTKCYSDLGFTVSPPGADVADVRPGGCAFFLQSFYVQERAENFVFYARIDNLDPWWEHIIPSTSPPSTGSRSHEHQS